MQRRVDRELAILLEIFEQRCVDQRVLADRYFAGKASTARSALARMSVAGDITVVSRRRRNSGVTAWSATTLGVERLKSAGLVSERIRYEPELAPERVAHQLAMNHVGVLLDIRLTHEHQLTMPDAVRAKSRTLPDAMFETSSGKRIYIEMDLGNYRAGRFLEKLDGIKDALGGWCELWIVTTKDERRSALLEEIGERKHVSWFVFEDVSNQRMPTDVLDPVAPWPTADEMIQQVTKALLMPTSEPVSVKV